MLMPRPIHPGDTLTMIAVSGTVHESDLAEEVQKARDHLASLGFRVKVDESCYQQYGYLSGTDVERAAALHRAFLDPETDGIVCFKGGYGCIRMIHLVDWELIRTHLKAFVGYSDITTLHLGFQRHGMISFHGPMGRTREPLEGTAKDCFLRALAGEALTYGPLDGNPFTCVRPGQAKGMLIGGNLSLVAASMGTDFMPDFEGKILFLEDIGEQIYALDRMLFHLKRCGVLQKLSGLVLGAFTDCTGEFTDSFSLEEVFDDVLADLSIPVLSGLHVGHVNQSLTLPLGRTCFLDSESGKLEILP